MRVRMEPAGILTTWWPLAGADKPGDVRIAGQSLRELQQAELKAAGIQWVAEGTEADASFRAHAWIARSDWGLFRADPSAGALVALDGTVLASRPNGSGVVEAQMSIALKHPWDILRLNELLVGSLTNSVIEGDLSPAAHVEGVLVLGKGSRILPGVYIEGNITIGQDCKIGPNCYLRGSTSIGNNCHIGQAVEIKNSIIGSNTNVGHLSYVGDSILGSRVNFGAGTIVSNLRHDGKTQRTQVGMTLVDTGRRKFGVVVGDGVHTGIHTSIYPGRKIGPGASTRPAAVVQRDLRDNEVL